VEAQNLNFNATCIKRGLLSVCVTCPKFAESVNLRGKANCIARYSCGRVDEAARIEEFLNRWLALFTFRTVGTGRLPLKPCAVRELLTPVTGPTATPDPHVTYHTHLLITKLR
jgi:hypothetical protein